MSIRRLTPPDADAFATIRAEALTTEPFAFGASPKTRADLLEFAKARLADLPDQAVFGCFADGALIGIVGVLRISGAKDCHKANIWGMYVAPQSRGQGVGRALLLAAIEYARAWPDVVLIQLSVTEPALAAKSLYESAGFHCWGREPRALFWNGQFIDEFHMMLDLR